MRKMISAWRLFMAACIGTLVAGGAAHAAPAPSGSWVLSYEGKSTNNWIWDKRARGLVESRLPAKLSADVLASLGGPPDPVEVADRRYVSVSACMPHSCPDKAFFWFDTVTGIGLGAAYHPDTLLIGSNGLGAGDIPAPAMRALSDWITDQKLAVASATFIGASGVSVELDAAKFAPRASFQPPPDGPSFECARASTAVEKRICSDRELARLDLTLADKVREIRLGQGTAPDRRQFVDLQRAWLKERDASCAAAAEMSACLARSYRAQYDRIMNWIPKH
ncbi:lysozyme inhibitor LprI family protein [Massilia sp. R2A-15]|uniref:lysozyme inhibitor LprI family protein n=1 Tax=Massilia sp. R2A-15 TaxID=3064278 RepID=UPI002733DBC8|nr:lysozyme inhibitor LprI family protein [Massilia sp. R2A-15]WLI87452.1 lysozyme inhibitor LprI family protein [Massilia sp. R2A-15]